ncbi:MAG: polysaccharide biosynthesis protein [Candidatus Paceibacterota bacterium]|jgi:UDP-N-acetylglucosamine 4,6-dehydratase
MKNIFITGGAGFLGKALIKHYYGNARLTIYSRDEAKQTIIRQLYPDCRFILGDIRDYDRLELAMGNQDIVIHAAAMKYVPQAEINVAEAIAVNVDGSKNVARAAMRNNVERVIGISTDKACNPINVYGMTKLCMERLFQEYAQLSKTKFNLVRYGNVIGSTGSVIPLFQKQARENKIITLTDPHMTRFWLSENNAVNLILRALEEIESGTVLIPRLDSCDMETLAKAVAYSELLNDNDKVELKTIGVRFGEKIHENLLAKNETPYTDWLDETIDNYRLIRLNPVWKGRKTEKKIIYRDYNSAEPDNTFDYVSLAKLIKES